MADGGCAGCFCYHAEFSGRDTVLYPAHDQAYFTSAITTMVIGWICAFLLCNGGRWLAICSYNSIWIEKQTALLAGICTSLFLVAPVEYHFYVAPANIALLENMRSFFLTVVWLPLNFSPFWSQPWIDFVGPISAQLGFALGYYCQWRSKNRSQIRKWSEWGTCLSFVTLGMMAWALR